MRSVASVGLTKDVPQEFASSIVEHMVFVHSSALRYAERFETQLRRAVYITPKNFLDFISNYAGMFLQVAFSNVCRPCKAKSQINRRSDQASRRWSAETD